MPHSLLRRALAGAAPLLAMLMTLGAAGCAADPRAFAPDATQEAQIRDIARQEVRAALNKPASAPASSDGDDQAPIGGGNCQSATARRVTSGSAPVAKA